MSYILTCCSTADLTKEHFERRSIPYVCFHFNLDGKQYPDDLGQTMPFEEFYARIAQGASPTTAQVNVDQFLAFFEPFLKQGKDILHVSLSSGLSGSYNSACIAKGELLEKYPDRRIEVVDSLGASSGYGLFMELLADRRDAGASLDELYAWAQQNKLRIHHWFFSTDLSAYIRGGRISKTAGVFGQMLGICPLLNMDAAGHLIPREKIRSKKRVITEIVERMKQHAEGGLDYSGKCFLSNSACYEDARAVADLVEATFPKLDGKVDINWVGTVIGAHTGCGTIALFFVGDERSDIVPQ
ncbi:MAG: DegV family protein [Oscillospiraceae bacterium]|nr:DegV family protein [Oscillospiraceae bacterium]